MANSNSSNGGFGSFSAAGGAIWADPQVGVTITSSQFLDNEAEVAAFSNQPGLASGGAIDINPGTYAFPTPSPSATTITNTVFSGNLAVGTGTSGSQAQGGAINAGSYSDPGGGTITIIGSTFIANQAMGDSNRINPVDELGGAAQGGAINTYLDALALSSDTFSFNEAVGGSGQTVQYALGGAINSQLYLYDNPFPTLTMTISNTLFTGNQAKGGTGVPFYNTYVDGGTLVLTDTPATLTNTSFVANEALGSPGTGVSYSPPYYGPIAIGGAVETTGAALSIKGGLISGNIARGGNGGDASGGSGGDGGYAWGGGIFVGGEGSLTLSGASITDNSAIGGAGGTGTSGGGGGAMARAADSTSTTGIGEDHQRDNRRQHRRRRRRRQGSHARSRRSGPGGRHLRVCSQARNQRRDLGRQLGRRRPRWRRRRRRRRLHLRHRSQRLAHRRAGCSQLALGGSNGGKGYGGGLYVAAGAITMLNNSTVVGNLASTSGNDIYNG